MSRTCDREFSTYGSLVLGAFTDEAAEALSSAEGGGRDTKCKVTPSSIDASRIKESAMFCVLLPQTKLNKTEKLKSRCEVH